MRLCKLAFVTSAAAVIAIGLAVAADAEKVPVYTGEDLDRMFGPAPPGPSVPIDKSRPEDWRWVEQFIDREYARIDADRQHELNRREVDIAARQQDEPERIYGGSLLWGLGAGYPGYAGWNVTGPGYARRNGAVACNGSIGRYARASGGAHMGGFRSSPAGAMRRAAGGSHAHALRAK
jgi:hypothetical protein